MRQIYKNMVLFIIGGIIYYFIETLWRGYSYVSMFFVGGLCFVFIGMINVFLSFDTPIWKQQFIATVIVTLIELAAGIVLNKWLNMSIWDYSNLPFNLWGQVSLHYSIGWFVLSAAAIILDDWLRYFLFKEEKPYYKLGIYLI